jgi:ArsR family transcriptional regulator
MEATMKQSYSEYAALFKAFSDETRLKIIDMLSCGEMCACDILEQLSLSQSTLSYHMKILSECGIVNAVRDGAWMRYTVSKVRAEEVEAFIGYITTDKEECICKGSKTCKIEEGEPIGK